MTDEAPDLRSRLRSDLTYVIAFAAAADQLAHYIGEGHVGAGLELADPRLSPGAVVLVARALDAMPGGEPLHSGTTRFPAHPVELDVEHLQE